MMNKGAPEVVMGERLWGQTGAFQQSTHTPAPLHTPAAFLHAQNHTNACASHLIASQQYFNLTIHIIHSLIETSHTTLADRRLLPRPQIISKQASSST
jgi:hypothetical protein